MKRDSLRSAGLFAGFLLLASNLHSQVSFFQPPSYAGSGSLFAGDFNGDGKPDLLSSDGTLQLGNGDGSFQTGTPVSGTPVAVADFNGDGRDDVLEQGNGTLLVLLGNGDGSFQQAVSTASGAVLAPAIAADLNGDGKADAVGVFNNALVVYLSKGKGTFAPGISYNLGSTSPSSPVVSFGDFNGDGKTDVAVSILGDNAAGPEIVLLGNGDGSFQAAKTSAGIYNPMYAATGDFNKDGRLDLAISSSGSCVGPGCSQVVSGGIYLFAGNGDGTFQSPVLVTPPVSVNDGFQAPSLVAADVNGDGKPDLVLQSAGTTAQVYLGNGDGTFTNASNYVLNFVTGLVQPHIHQFAAADFNGDGKIDIAVSNAVLLGNADGTFQAIRLGVVPIFGANNLFSVAVAGNFDKKRSVPSVAVAVGQQAGSISPYNLDILSNDGHGTLSLAQTYSLQQRGAQIATADLNGDGALDLLVFGSDPSSGDWSYSVLLGNGDGSFQQPILYPQNFPVNGSGRNSVIVGDFNNDKKPDFAFGGLKNASLAVVMGAGDGTFAEPAYVFDGGDTYLMAADFNGDGKVDIAAGILTETAGSSTAETALLLGNGDGTFQAANYPSSLTNFEAVSTADLNNDGKPDLAANGAVAMGKGDGTFTVLPLPGTYAPIGIADFNGDGILDLLASDESSRASIQTAVLLGNGDGTFQPSAIPVPQPIGGTAHTIPQPALIADMNSDGRPDIAFVSVDSLGGVGVILNTTPADFALSVSALSPAVVAVGNSVSATIHVGWNFGTSGSVMLGCSGLPSGASCAFNPPSVPSGSTSSSLVISTTSSVAPGTYPVEVEGAAGSQTHAAALSLVIQAAPDFEITGPSSLSRTVNAGQSAIFSVALTPVGAFSGTLSLGCKITPVTTPAPICTLSSSSLHITGTASQTVTVTVATTAPATTSALGRMLHSGFPLVAIPLLGFWGCMLRRKRLLLSLQTALVAAAFLPWIGCGGGMHTPPPSQTTPGTPARTYTATVTASSGMLTHEAILQVVVVQ